MMNPTERTQWIGERARAIGFDLCGVASVEALADPSHLDDWLARGYAGEMRYLHDARRKNPRLVLPGARSVIVVALNYNSPQPYSTKHAQARDTGPPRGWISRYAWGDDYHGVLGQKLEALVADMHAQFPEPFDARAYVDTGPVVERVAAKHAGLGWLAKNTCLINTDLGSWLFLGVIVTTLDLAPSVAPGQGPPADHCGTCTACLDACPTEAFVAPYVLDARRCISYLTIELRGPIPEEFRPAMGNALIGCDICQDVCPWNRKSSVTHLAEFQPRKGLEKQPSETENRGIENSDSRNPNGENRFSLCAPELEGLASLTQEQFSRLFHHSAVKRAKFRGLVRNACVALGNSSMRHDSGDRSRIAELLDRLANSRDSLVSEHARWAKERLVAAQDSD
ncbi:MAG: tRNA epoxyqueuosine(34) reductase QueG [Candidatus Acidiferrales bacterium]